MTTRFTPQLERDVAMRAETSDAQTWVDTFVELYHVPPPIDPKYVLDIGANIGLTSAHYAAMWPSAQVVAVEMDADNAAVCRRNFSGLVVEVAVGAATGNGSYQREGWEARYSLLRPGDTFVRILTITQILDDCMPNADEVFCKMDIEGAEWGILTMGIDQRVKWLLIEIHDDEPPYPTIEEAMEYLQDDGFTVARHVIHPLALWASR